MIDTGSIPPLLAPTMEALQQGMALKKCRRCGCMAQALHDAATGLGQAEDIVAA